MPDNVLQMLPKNGGVVMVTFVPGFLSSRVAQWNADRQRAEAAIPEAERSQPDRVRASMEAWDKAHPAPRATIADAADHIDHIRKIAGIDHIGIGGDFDGITTVVEGLEDVSTYPALSAELLRRGYKDDDIKKVLGLNILRVMRDAESVAATLQKERAASPLIFTK